MGSATDFINISTYVQSKIPIQLKKSWTWKYLIRYGLNSRFRVKWLQYYKSILSPNHATFWKHELDYIIKYLYRTGKSWKMVKELPLSLHSLFRAFLRGLFLFSTKLLLCTSFTNSWTISSSYFSTNEKHCNMRLSIAIAHFCLLKLNEMQHIICCHEMRTFQLQIHNQWLINDYYDFGTNLQNISSFFWGHGRI